MKKIFKVSAFLAIVAGVILVAGAVWGIYFTYQNVSQENITTPADSTIPGQLVRGPLTLKSQADVIREHTLQITEGKTYAQMDREDPNRDIWITATTLTTALNLGILTYVFSALILLFGCVSVWTGMVFWVIGRKNRRR